MRSKIYILPNLITMMSLFCGCLSIRFSLEGLLGSDHTFKSHAFLLSAYSILFAGFFDGLDGRVARLTNTQSPFGVELDSLSDLLSFGVAPAILAYSYALRSMGKPGFALCFIFIACGVLRLARFNVQSSLGKANGNFTGIPIPMAAASLCAIILAQLDMREWAQAGQWPAYLDWLGYLSQPQWEMPILAIVVLMLALGMVSTFEYVSTKNLKFPKKRPFRLLATLVIVTTIIFTFEHIFALACVLFLYCLHGPLMFLFYHRDKETEEDEIFESEEGELP